MRYKSMHAHPVRRGRRGHGTRHSLSRRPRRAGEAARRAGGRLGPCARLPRAARGRAPPGPQDLGLHDGDRGQRGPELPYASLERARRHRRRVAAQRARPESGAHLLVYQTYTTHAELPRLLEKTGLECRIYGLRRDLREPVREGKLVYMPFSERQLVEDLRTARGVVASGGFTLMSEAVYLHRPV